VVLQASIAPLASHVSNHAKKFAHVTVKELVVITNYMLQILQTLLHCFHGLETFIGRRVEIPDGLTASSTTHRMQSEGVFIAIVSTVVATVVASSIVIAALVAIVTVTEPPKIIPYYRLSRSTWPLSNNKELLSRFRRVKPGKSHTTGSLICAKPTRRRDQSTTLRYIKGSQVRHYYKPSFCT
jgi:hypothetical protein